MKYDNIWDGYRLGENRTGPLMIADQNENEESIIPTIFGIAFCIIAIIAMFAIPMIGPSLWHNALVVCSGQSCKTYTEWTVINENSKTGVLEVWAGGRLQRLSNGSWHYE